MGRTLKWPGIMGKAANELGGARYLSQYLGYSYSTLNRWSKDENRIPKTVMIVLQTLTKEDV